MYKHDSQQVRKGLSYLSAIELEFLEFLVKIGVPIATLPPLRKADGPEYYWKAAKGKLPSLSRIKTFKPGNAIVAGTGGPLAVFDVDPRNGGLETFELLKHLLPKVVAKVKTPGDGWHYYVNAIAAPSISFKGIDYLGAGRQVFTLGTQRPKYDNRGYELVEFNTYDPSDVPDSRFYDAMLALKQESAGTKGARLASTSDVNDWVATKTAKKRRGQSEQGQLYGPYGYISMSMQRVTAAPTGERFETLRREAFKLGHFNINDPYFPGVIMQALVHACEQSGFAQEHQSNMVRTISDAVAEGRLDQQEMEN